MELRERKLPWWDYFGRLAGVVGVGVGVGAALPDLPAIVLALALLLACSVSGVYGIERVRRRMERR